MNVKPCHWCGSAWWEHMYDGDSEGFHVECRSCGAAGPLRTGETDEQAQRRAIAAWNIGPIGARTRRVS